MSDSTSNLPALRLDHHGQRHVDWRAVFALALPMILQAVIQALIGLTDTWFVARLSTEATAALGASFLPVMLALYGLGGIGLAVQPLVAQAQGAGDRPAAGRAVWTGLLAVLVLTPFYVALALWGAHGFSWFKLAPGVEQLAGVYWEGRLWGAPVVVASWVMTSFFNGIGQTRTALLVAFVSVLLNVPLNELLIFTLGYGVAGAAWASNLANLGGLLLAAGLFLLGRVRGPYVTCHPRWPTAAEMAGLMRIGLPLGAMTAAELIGISLFQLMLTSHDPVAGAVTQIIFAVTSLSFWPAFGLGMAGTTLVGQAIGAGDVAWARTLGNRIILVCVAYMGGLGLLLALAGPWVLPLFVTDGDPQGLAVVALGLTVLWIAAAYQMFDGFNIATICCLRGAGDVTAPAVATLLLSFGVLVPLTHMLTFQPGHGWVGWLPQWGFGAIGGWIAISAYIGLFAVAMSLRWRSSRWQRRVQLSAQSPAT